MSASGIQLTVLLLGTASVLALQPDLNSILLIITLELCAYYAVTCYQNRNLPPGPPGWPIIGNLLDLGNQPFLTFVEIGKKYGHIFTIYFGSQKVVVINDPKLIMETFSKTEFCGRPLADRDLERMGGERRGLIFTEGQHWFQQRRFVLQHLKGFGFGKMSMEGIISSEVQELIQVFKKDLDQSITVGAKFHRSLVNAVWQLVAGSRFPHDDERFISMQSKAQLNIKAAQMVGMLRFSPWLLRIWELVHGRTYETSTPILDYMREVIQEHKNSFVVGQLRDLIDAFLNEVKDTDDIESKNEADFNLLIVVFDMFVSSPHAVSFALTWATVLLSIHPNVQRKLQNEIRDVVGDGEISLSHKKQMPYTNAVIKEVMRFTQKTTLNGATFHLATEDTYLKEFRIPKDTFIIANLYHSTQNAKIFNNPEQFRPERFILDDGKSLQKFEELMPFSTGKRDCIGKSVALDELFLYVSNIFQYFNIGLDPNQTKPVIDYPNITFTNPSLIAVIFRDRTEK